MASDGAVIQLVTRCHSEDEFIERFARFTSEHDVVVPALPGVSVGSTGRFVICLKDRTVMMKGRCEVTEIRPVAAGSGDASAPARALMRLHLLEMDPHSCGLHMRLMERRAAAPKPSAPAAAPAAKPARALSLVPPVDVVPPPVREAVPAPPPLAAQAASAREAAAARSPLAVPAAPALAPAPTPPPSTIEVMSIPRPPPRRAVPAPALSVAPAAAPALAIAPTPAPIPVAAVVAAPAGLSEPTEISPAPRPEARAPGADFKLPANPLSDLDADELASFIELQLLEGNGAVDTAVIARARLVRAQRIARRAAPYAACVVIGLLLGIALRPGAKRGPAAVPTVGRPAAVASTAAREPAAIPEMQAPARRDCVARVTTKPAGATVFWGDVAVGSTPIAQAAVPCGAAVVTFRRERYAELTRSITTERGQSAVITERMVRPPARVVVTSSPPRAQITLNRRRVGPAPRKIATMRFEHVRIEARLPGYQPWKKTVYLKEPESTFDVTLVPIAKPPARRAPAAAAKPR